MNDSKIDMITSNEENVRDIESNNTQASFQKNDEDIKEECEADPANESMTDADEPPEKRKLDYRNDTSALEVYGHILVHKNYTYNRTRYYASNNIFWKCRKSRKQCGGNLTTDHEVTAIVRRSKPHNHEPHTDKEIENIRIKKKLKEMAVKNLTNPPSDLINHVACENDKGAIRNMRQLIYRKRKALLKDLNSSEQSSAKIMQKNDSSTDQIGNPANPEENSLAMEILQKTTSEIQTTQPSQNMEASEISMVLNAKTGELNTIRKPNQAKYRKYVSKMASREIPVVDESDYKIKAVPKKLRSSSKVKEPKVTEPKKSKIEKYDSESDWDNDDVDFGSKEDDDDNYPECNGSSEITSVPESNEQQNEDYGNVVSDLRLIGSILVYKNYSYRRLREYKNKNKFWKCRKRVCNGYLTTNHEVTEVLAENKPHFHEPHCVEDLAKLEMKLKLKDLAIKELTNMPADIMNRVDSEDDLAVKALNRRNMRQIIYRRRKALLKQPDAVFIPKSNMLGSKGNHVKAFHMQLQQQAFKLRSRGILSDHVKEEEDDSEFPVPDVLQVTIKEENLDPTLFNEVEHPIPTNGTLTKEKPKDVIDSFGVFIATVIKDMDAESRKKVMSEIAKICKKYSK